MNMWIVNIISNILNIIWSVGDNQGSSVGQFKRGGHRWYCLMCVCVYMDMCVLLIYIIRANFAFFLCCVCLMRLENGFGLKENNSVNSNWQLRQGKNYVIMKRFFLSLFFQNWFDNHHLNLIRTFTKAVVCFFV